MKEKIEGKKKSTTQNKSKIFYELISENFRKIRTCLKKKTAKAGVC